MRASDRRWFGSRASLSQTGKIAYRDLAALLRKGVLIAAIGSASSSKGRGGGGKRPANVPPLLHPSDQRRQAWLAASAASKSTAAQNAQRHSTKSKKARKAAAARRKQAREQAAQEALEAEMERYDTAAEAIQAVERGRVARIKVARMRESAKSKDAARATYMPKMAKMKAKLKVTGKFAAAAKSASGDPRDKAAIHIQAASRRRRARLVARQRHLEREADALHEQKSSVSANQLWDAHGNPMPVWLDSLPTVFMSKKEIKDIRAMRLPYVTTRCAAARRP